tara:strand:+ start:141 stop:833 length:693 start_codon:yes stop_codon:yes gene_type:complete
MAYSVRGKFINQNKYSTRRVNQLLDLTAIQAKDSLIIEEQAQKAIDKAAKAKKKSERFGLFRKIASPFTGLVGDALLGLADAAYSDRLRDKAISGIDQRPVVYYGDAAANADRKVKEATKQITKGMKFGDKAVDVAKDIGINQALDTIKNSKAYADFKKDFDADFDVLKKEGLGEGRLLDLTKDGANFYLKEMKKFFKNPSDYLEAVKLYQNRNNPNTLLLEFLQSREDK